MAAQLTDSSHDVHTVRQHKYLMQMDQQQNGTWFALNRNNMNVTDNFRDRQWPYLHAENLCPSSPTPFTVQSVDE